MIQSVIYRSVVVVTMLCMAFGLQAQSISYTIDRKDILIGEPIHYSVKFSVPHKSYQIFFQLPDSLAHFEIMEKKVLETTAESSYSQTLNLKITSWDSGKWFIPSIPIRVAVPGKTTPFYVKTDPQEINVGYAPDDGTGQLRDIKQVMDVKLVDNTWWYILAGLLLLALIGYFIFRYIRKQRTKPKPIFESSLTPFDEAIGSLDKLKTLNLREPSQVKQFHSSISDIFRRYYSRRRQTNFMNQTTGDVLIALKNENSSSETLTVIADGLRHNDAVKFAKFIPQETESLASLEKIKAGIQLIENQKPKER